MPLHSRGTRLPGTVPNSQAVVSNLRVQALLDLRFNVTRHTAHQEASVTSSRTDLDESMFHVARCDRPGVSVFHGPEFTEHNVAKLFTIARSGQGAVERMPVHQGDTDGPHIHKWVNCSPAKLCQRYEHQSQNMMRVDGGSLVSSGPVALPHEKSTAENMRTQVLQKVHHSFKYHILQWIHRRPTMIGNSLQPVSFPS